ncbi:MAG: PilW family protein [Gammaproteobacteria bacterium]
MNRLHPQTKRQQHGLTLVEIMVAITISLVLLAGIIKIFQSAKQSYNIQQALSRVQENARLLTDVMVRDLSNSGYLGCLGATDKVINTLQDKAGSYDFATAIQGTEGGADPDAITLRHVSEATAIPVVEPMTDQKSSVVLDADHMNYGSLQQWDVVTVSDCAGAAVFMITNDPDDTGVIQHAAGVAATSGPNETQTNTTEDLERIFGAQTASSAKIYRVGTTSYQLQASSSGKGKSLFVSPGGELVEGVDDLQIQYGIGSTPANSTTPVIAEQYVDADNVTDWTNVVSVRITFSVNSVDMVVNPGDGDGLLHKTFTTTVRLRNRAPA